MKSKLDKYIFHHILGRGAQGTVHKITDKQGNVFALKQCKKKTNAYNEHHVSNVMCHHPNIVKIFEYIEDENEYYLIMEYIDGYTLYDMLHNQSYFLSESEARYYMHSVMNGLRCMHKHGYVHRDLKLENIMLKHPIPNGKILHEDVIIKLLDLGLCTTLEMAQLQTNLIGSRPYISPEIQRGYGCTSKCDMWSLGVVLYELLFRNIPFDSENVFEQNVKIPSTRKVTKEAKHLICMLLMHNPSERLSLDDVFNHPWVLNQKVCIHKLWSKKDICAYTRQSLKCSFNKSINLQYGLT